MSQTPKAVTDLAWDDRVAHSRLRTRAWLWLAVSLSGACFVEQPAIMAGEPDPMCNPGEIGCACTTIDTCAANLTCLVANDVCIPTGCAPGSAFCTCDSGECQAALVCQDGTCSPRAGGSAGTGSNDDDDTTVGAGTGSAATTAASITGTDATTGADVDTGDTSDTMTSLDTGVGEVCSDQPTCAACFSCSAGPTQGCQAEASACQTRTGCGIAAACMQMCSVDGLCLDNCCSGASPAAIAAAQALEACRREACAPPCSDFNNAECMG